MTGRADDPPPFDLAPYIERLGPSVVEHALNLAADAPPFFPEQEAALRTLFAPAVSAARKAKRQQDPAA